jgi:hypothetical protein
MTFENKSKRKLTFAPRIVALKNDQADFRILIQEMDFTHTEKITAPSKMIYVVGNGNSSIFEKLPELTLIEGNFSLTSSMTLLAAKLKKIDGDLFVGSGAKFYAPCLEEVTGFVYLDNGAVVNAAKIEHLFANDDDATIQVKAGDEWLNNL